MLYMKLTDWNNLQWESRKLERLLLDYFDDLTLGNHINTGYQTFYFLMQEVDSKLRDYWMNNRICFKELYGDKVYNTVHDDNFNALYHQNDWEKVRLKAKYIDERFQYINDPECPWFILYYITQKLHPMDAVRDLALKFDLSIPDAFYSCYLRYEPQSKNSPCRVFPIFDRQSNQICTICQHTLSSSNETFFTLPQEQHKSIPLFNLKQLELVDLEDTPLPPVLLCDSIPAAYDFQKHYTEVFHEQLKKDWLAWWNRKRDLCSEAIPKTIKHLENSLVRNEHNVCDDFNKIVNTLQEATLYYNNPKSGGVAPLLNLICTSWFGSYDLLDYTDWTPVLNRKVFFCQTGNDYRTALEHFLCVYSTIRKQQQEQLLCCQQTNTEEADNQEASSSEELSFIFCHCPQKTDPIDISRNDIHVLRSGEALVEAQKQRLHIPQILEDELDEQCRLLRKYRRQDKRYLIKPVIRKESFTLLTGVRGNGKSYMAMTLAAAIATKGDLFNNWVVEQRAKVLYVMDSEMSKAIYEERLIVLRKAFSKHGFENFHIEPVKDLDIRESEGQKQVEDMINHTSNEKGTLGLPVSLVILDHLTKLSDSEGDQKKEWPKIRNWIEQLIEKKKIAVMVVQHEYQHRVKGTVLIDNDAETTISVERLPDDRPTCLKLALRVPRNRSGKDQLTPFIVTLDMAGKPPKWTELSSPQKQSTENYSWKGMSDEDKVKYIMEWSNNMRRIDIASKFNISKSTLEKFLTKHKLSKSVNTHPEHHKYPSRKHLDQDYVIDQPSSLS